jgi:hypothetical protein
MSFENIKLFEDLMNPDREIRMNAEGKLGSLKQHSLEVGLSVFKDGMNAEKAVVSQLATLLLKKTYLDDPEVLKVLTPDQLSLMKALLIENLNFQKEWKTLQRIGEALAKIYTVSDLRSSFADIMAWFNNENPVTKQFAILLIEILCDHKVLKDDVVKDAVNDFHAIFQKGLLDSDVKVRVSSLKAITQFLTNLNKDLIMKFSSLTSAIIDTLIYALKNDEEKGKSALESLNYLTEAHPKYWKENFETFLHVLYEIIREKSFGQTIRESALEIIYTLANKTPAFIRKSNNFIVEIIPMLFDLLLDVNDVDNLEAWNKLTAEEENQKENMIYSVNDGIRRLSIDIGGKFMLENCTPYIKRYLASSNWIEQHAAFIAIAYMSEACKDLYKTNIVDLLQFVSSGLVHEHVRVKYAALTALAFLAEDTAPLIQKKYHSNILPAICKLMQESSSLRLTTQACSTLVNFLKGLVDNDDEEAFADLIKPYASELLTFLTGLFENSITINYAPLQEETLTNLSLLATLLDKDFAPYYNQIMPGLKQIFYQLTPTTHEQETLKSHAIETMSYLCSSVSENAESFFEDFKELTMAFGKLLVTLKEEDPQVIAILNGFTHISTSMKEHFYPYLEDLFPILEKYINTDIDFKLEDADIKEYVPEENEKSEKLQISLTMPGMDNKTLSMNTHALQNKIMAVEVLYNISLNMGVHFYPFLTRYLAISKKLLQFPYNRKIRKLSAKSLLTGILACTNDEQRREVVQYLGMDIVNVLDYVIKGRLLREIKMILKVFINVCEEVENTNIFTEDFIKQLYDKMNKAVLFIEQHKTTVKETVKAEEGFDENDEDILENDLETLGEATRRVMELNGLLFKLYKDSLIDIIKTYLFDTFFKIWDKAIKETKSDQEYLTSLCFFDDYLSYCTQQEFNLFYPTFIKYAMAYQTKNEDIIQSIVFGFGVIAQRVPKDKWPEIANTILSTINNVLARDVTDENECTFDNAVGALGKAIYFQTEVGECGYQLASKFLNLLPVKNDLEESENIVKLLLQELLNSNPILCEPTVLKNAKEAIKRINEFRTKEEEILDGEGLAMMVNVVQHFGIN